MYDALHNAEQMLPHLEHIELPDPLPNVKTLNVICYDFVPQLFSILQNQQMMSSNNLVLDPNNPLAMYKPHDSQLGEALSGSVYQDMYRRLVSNPSIQYNSKIRIVTTTTLSAHWTLEMPGPGLAIVHLVASTTFANVNIICDIQIGFSPKGPIQLSQPVACMEEAPIETGENREYHHMILNCG
jgi:hypothetical protein